MKDALKATLRDLSALHGVSGFEQPLVEYFRKRATGLVDDVQVDRYGNVAAIKRGRQERPRLMLAAHLDEIGFIVKAVDERGVLFDSPNEVVDLDDLVAAVRVLTRFVGEMARHRDLEFV